jgi:ribose transport system substrate-binding protein
MAKRAPQSLARPPYVVRAVVRAADLLRAFRHDGESLRLTDLAQRTGLHKTTAFRLLTSLEAGGLVSRAAADRYQSKVRPIQWSGLKFGLAGRIRGYPFAEEVLDSMQQAAEKEGIDLVFLENRRSAKTALANADRLIRAGVNLAFVYQPDYEIASAISTKFAAAAVPLIAIGFPHPDATYYGANNFQAGLMAGRALGRWVNQHWDGQIGEALILKPPKIAPVPQSRLVGVEAGIRETLSEAHHYRVVELSAQPSHSGGLAAVRRYLRASKPRRILVAGMNDATVTGGLRAFEELGRAENCVGVGQGASPDGRAELRRPHTRLIGSVTFFPENYGTELVALALKILGNRPVPAATIIRHQLVTPENVDRLYPNDALRKPVNLAERPGQRLK